MTRILLIRHAHTDLSGKVLYGRMPGIHLSEQGRQEAMKLARALHDRYEISQIVSSPMDRARETAEEIAALYRIQVEVDEEFEELDFGEWMGKSFTELMQDERWKLYNRRRSLTGAPGGEFMLQVQIRAWNAIERLVGDTERESTFAIITHGDVVRGLLMLFLGMPIDHIHRLEVSTASLSEVILGRAFPQVIRVNQTF